MKKLVFIAIPKNSGTSEGKNHKIYWPYEFCYKNISVNYIKQESKY